MGTQIKVYDKESLVKTLSNLKGGEVILVADGDYGDIEIRDMDFEPPVTIKSLDADAPATFNSIYVLRSSGITLDTVIVDRDVNDETNPLSAAVEIKYSEDVKVVNSELIGGLATHGDDPSIDPSLQKGPVIGYPTDRGIYVYESDNLEFSGNEISLFQRGIVALHVDGLTVTESEIHHMRSSPLVGADVDNVLVDGNHFHSSTPWSFGGEGDHGDYVHFYTRSAIQEDANTNITITNNLFAEGDGHPILGVLLSSSDPNKSYDNVLIEGNIIHTSHTQGIAVEGGDNISILNNSLITSGGPDATLPGLVLRDDLKNVTVENNILGRIDTRSANENTLNLNDKGNVIYQTEDPQASNFLGDILLNPFVNSAEIVFDDFTLLPDSGITHAGAVAFDSTPDVLTARITSDVEIGSETSLIAQFDASLSADANGILNANVEYIWDFGDGTIGRGESVSHAYEQEGDYQVQLTIIDGANTVQKSHNVTVYDPHVLSLSGKDNDLVFSGDSYINLGTDREFFGLEKFYLEIDFKKDDVETGSKEVLFNNQARYSVRLNGDDIQVRVYVNDGDLTTIIIPDAGVTDGDWHKVAVAFNGEEGTVNVSLDGKTVASESDVFGSVEGVSNWDVTVGGTIWGSEFSGEIGAVNLWSHDTPVAGGTILPTIDAVADNGTLVIEDTPTVEENLVDEVVEVVQVEATVPTLSSFEQSLNLLDDNDFIGSAYVEDSLIFFNGNGRVNWGAISEHKGAESLTVMLEASDLQLTSKDTPIWAPGSFGIQAQGENLIVVLYTTEGRFTAKATGAVRDLHDGGTHNLGFTYDGDKGELTAYLDGEVIASRSGIEGDLRLESGRQITIGGRADNYQISGVVSDVAILGEVNTDVFDVESLSTDTVLDTVLDVAEAETGGSTPNDTQEAEEEVIVAPEVVTEPEVEDIFEQDTGSETIDFSNVDITLSSLNAESFIGGASQVDDQLVLNGNGYVDLGALSSLRETGEITVSLDIKTSGLEAKSTPIWSPGSFGMEVQGSSIVFSIHTSEGRFTAKASGLADQIGDDQWHRIGMTYDAETGVLSAYYDGELVASKSGVSGNIEFSDSRSITVGGNETGDYVTGVVENVTLLSSVDQSLVSVSYVDTASNITDSAGEFDPDEYWSGIDSSSDLIVHI